MLTEGETFKKVFVVDEKTYNGFIALFEDKNPLHTNAAFARRKGFNDRVMHGNILGGFLSYFIGEMLPLKEVIIHSQKIDYKKPVYLNDRLSFTAILETFSESVKTAEFKFIFENESKIKVAVGKIQIGII